MKSNKEIKPNLILQPFEHLKWKMIGDTLNLDSKNLTKETKSTWSNFALKYAKSFSGLLGFFILITLIIGAFIIPIFAKDPETTNVDKAYLTFYQKGHFLGTDRLGRDMWSRLWSGLRFSLSLAFFVGIIEFAIGVMLGILMGKFSKFDKLMQSLLKVLVNVPFFLMMIIFVLIFGASFWVLLFSLTCTGWIAMSLQVRSVTKRINTMEWNVASKILATPEYKQVLAFLPHLIPIIITQLITAIPSTILAETTLSFLNLSVSGQPTLGSIISDGTQLIGIYPRYILMPSLFLVLTVSSIQFIGLTTQDILKKMR